MAKASHTSPPSDKVVYDYTGLKCPLPVLKTRRALSALEAGTIVVILADDPAAPLDFEHFCETSGHTLMAVSQQDSQFSFTIQKQG